jgi:hypothetical protein
MKKTIIALVALTFVITTLPAQANTQKESLVPTLVILDTALDTSIPLIKSKLIQEVCILDWPSCPNGSNFMEGPGASVLPINILSNKNFSHGTQMASVAIANNPNMNILFIRIVAHTSSGLRKSTGVLTITNALEWVFENKDKYNIVAVSASQGNHSVIKRTNIDYCPYTATDIMVNRLYLENIPVFFPSGNNRDRYRINWPACILNSIAVGGVDFKGFEPKLSLTSNYDGNLIDLWAPINSIALLPGGSNTNAYGTSVSNQIAAAKYIALKNSNTSIKVDELLEIIKNTATPVNNTLNQKIFMINLTEALKKINVDLSKSQHNKTTPPPAPKDFSDLYENRAGISQSAWSKSSEIIKASKAKYGTLEIYTGPNTKPYFDDYRTPISLVSRLFSNFSEPSKTIVIRYNFDDLDWADKITREKLIPSDYEQAQRDERNQLVSSNCSKKPLTASSGKVDLSSLNCRGAKQFTTASGVSMILQGVENKINLNDPTSKSRFYTGMLEAHEYFHSLQQIPIIAKSNVRPHAWFREGSAEWVQNVSINYKNYLNYKEFLQLDCSPICTRLSESDIREFLETSNQEYSLPKFDRWLNYSLGAYIIEALVALKGPDTLIEMYAQMSNRITFDQAFKNTYGVEWSYAIPILAKTIYANLKQEILNG